MEIDQLANRSAEAIKEAFEQFHQEFKAFSQRAKPQFENRDWLAVQKDATARLELYTKIVTQVVAEIKALQAAHIQDRALWMKIKEAFSQRIEGRGDLEIIETFFNSVTRRIFSTVGVDPLIEYLDAGPKTLRIKSTQPIYHTYYPADSTTILVRAILRDTNINYSDINLYTKLVAERIDARLATKSFVQIDIIRPLFYRNKGAYVIGRIAQSSGYIPFILALLNTEQGISVDAVLMTENEASLVFSFTRSYFFVEAERPHELIDFLSSIMPLKRVAELYISIGYNKHGKTLLYKDLLRHLKNSQDKFEIAPGNKGMVMTVFTMPSYDLVFKIIKDRFSPPKTSTRSEVIAKYHLVFMRDRAGRLIDAQEFEHLSFDKARFAEELLEELTKFAASSVTIEGDCVIIKHLYSERRVVPLNIYLREWELEAAKEAVLDYGSTIKELAAANIFPGDTLLKNFGVTRQGRVVFYDYDELCLLTECNFREMPTARISDDELEAETWFSVAEKDIFPIEFKTFLGLEGELRDIFIEAHGDLFGVEFWQRTQEKIRAGEVSDIFPYKQERRLNPQSI